ncbi:hypothetical protein BJV78DRAFT_1125349 [Lactifluus subvellereus]|nr:hypothetical protein BJV78DRAFT_1125349 [Lactifluus subvellereus]
MSKALRSRSNSRPFQDLSATNKSDKHPRKDYLIVDVRDDEYIGGNITNCHNALSVTFLDDLVRDAKEIPQGIFHCAFSQSRGPKAARATAGRQRYTQQVLILRGGFTEFQAKFKVTTPYRSMSASSLIQGTRMSHKLVENWNKHIWAADWSF